MLKPKQYKFRDGCVFTVHTSIDVRMKALNFITSTIVLEIFLAWFDGDERLNNQTDFFFGLSQEVN